MYSIELEQEEREYVVRERRPEKKKEKIVCGRETEKKNGRRLIQVKAARWEKETMGKEKKGLRGKGTNYQKRERTCLWDGEAKDTQSEQARSPTALHMNEW